VPPDRDQKTSANTQKTSANTQKTSANTRKQAQSRKQFLQDALAAWNHYQSIGLHLTAAEADAWLARLAAGD
jgi:hypothetical protein